MYEVFNATLPFRSFIEVVDNNKKKNLKKIKFEDLKDDKDIFFGHKNIQINSMMILTGKNGCGKTKFLKMLEKNCLREKISTTFDYHQFISKEKSLENKNFKMNNNHEEFISGIIKNLTQLDIQQKKNYEQSTNMDNQYLEQIKTQMKTNYNEKLNVNIENLVDKEIEEHFKIQNEYERLLSAKQVATYLLMIKTYTQFTENVLNSPLCAIRKIASMQKVLRKYLTKQKLDKNEKEFLKLKTQSPNKISRLECEKENSLLSENRENLEHEINKILIQDWIESIGNFKDPLEFVNKDLEKFYLRLYLNDDYSINIEKTKPGKTEFETIEPSSGELFIIKLFAMKYINTKFLPVDIILLDEPDRHLEPKLIEIFYSVLKELSRLGIQIFMTTHRPDTISLADPDTIWTIDLDKQTHERQIKKCHKFSALFKLTYNLRELMNFKIKVYVESHIDFKFYEIMYGILMKYSNEIRKQNSQLTSQDRFKSCGFNGNRILSRRYQLEFCSSAKTLTGGGGGKNVLMDFLRRELSSIEFQKKFYKKKNLDNSLDLFKPFGLRDNDEDGNSDYENNFQIIPDLKNRIICTKRYSLENYLYDPILICSLFDRDFFEGNNLKEIITIKESIDQNSEPDYSFLINRLDNFPDIKNKIQQLISKNKLTSKDDFEENEEYVYKFKEEKPVTIKYPKVLKVLKGHLIEKVFEDVFSNGLIGKIDKKINELFKYFRDTLKKALKINDKDALLFAFYKQSLTSDKHDVDAKLQETFDTVFRKIIQFILTKHPKIFFNVSYYFKIIKMSDVKELTNISSELKEKIQEMPDDLDFFFPQDLNYDDFEIKKNKDLQILSIKFILKTDKTYENTNYLIDEMVLKMLNDRQCAKYPKIFDIFKSFHQNQIGDISRLLTNIFECSSYNCVTLGDKILEKLNETHENMDKLFFFPLDLAENFFDLNKKVREQITEIIKREIK